MQKFGLLSTSFIYAGTAMLTIWSLTACSSAPKILSVKSFPAEADVCVKGRAGSELLDNKTTCIGQTPFEADHFDYVSADGKKHRVEFKDLKAQESFYLMLRKDGYATQSVSVPSWEQFLSLNREQNTTPVQVNIPAPSAPIAAIPAPAQAEAKIEHTKTGGLRILSNPPGALVYINGALQGNTPYVYQYPLTNGTTNITGGVKVKLEAPGFQAFERMVNLNQAEAQEINFQLDKAAGEQTARRIPASVSESSETGATAAEDNLTQN